MGLGPAAGAGSAVVRRDAATGPEYAEQIADHVAEIGRDEGELVPVGEDPVTVRSRRVVQIPHATGRAASGSRGIGDFKATRRIVAASFRRGRERIGIGRA